MTTTVQPSSQNTTYTSSRTDHSSSKGHETTPTASGTSHFLPKQPLLLLMHLLAPTSPAVPSMPQPPKAISPLSSMAPCLAQPFQHFFEPSNVATSPLSQASLPPSLPNFFQNLWQPAKDTFVKDNKDLTLQKPFSPSSHSTLR